MRLAATTAALLVLGALACTGWRDKHARGPHKVSVLKSECEGERCRGTIAYSDPSSSDWWFYSYDYAAGSPPSPPAQAGRLSLPPGGAWSRGQAPDRTKIEEEEEVEIEETPEGAPETPEEADANEATEASSTEASSTEASSSGGDDGGGGGDGGGGE
jgi:hypothetical protein